MIISGPAIGEYVKQGELGISPFEPGQVQPNSYDFRLGSLFALVDWFHDEEAFSLKRAQELSVYELDSQSITLAPHQAILGLSYESFKLPCFLAAEVKSKSSLGRLFLTVTAGGAGWVDSGFRGHIVLEIVNMGSFPIKLEAGMRIGQLVFHHCMGAPALYRGSYQDQVGLFVDQWKGSLEKLGGEKICASPD